MAPEIKPGLLVLHGNRLELLGDAVFEWIGGNPLGALEEEIFLVQSNGVAEWLKMTIAQRSGICAATQVELPGRFLWRAYRQVLGRAAVPAQSALDKLPLTWRLMQLLPETSRCAGFEPLKGFLQRGGAERRLQLAQRLADLYDQYQVYRGDWLDAWAAGADILPASGFGSSNASTPLPADQAWQAALWRELLLPVTAKELASSRPQLHQRFTASLEAGIAPASAVPRRVVVFGMTHLPMQTLQALAALSGRAQVILAVLNPCRYHWADIIEGRELLRAKRRRHPLRDGKELSGVALQEMHAHAHPLLAAWGRQGRDFVRQLDQFDDVQTAQRRIAVPRVDLFDDEPAVGMLQEVQAAIRDLVPLAEHPRQEADPVDRSIVFHIAHSAQREVEILHDQLLELLAQAHSRRPINPRDVVVMVPDIEVFTPAIRSVFGQYARGDSRHIPFDIADLQERGHNPLLGAIEWLLRIADQRCTQSEIRDLLDVPSVASRFGLQPEGLPRLTQWIEGAGVRWGLNESQRSLLGLGACGDMNTWHFGMRRMLLGYASGAEAVPSTDPGLGGRQTDFEGIEPYAEVGGLDASFAGSLGALVDALAAWWMESGSDAAPAQWARRIRQMTEDFVAPTDDEERLTVAALLDSVQRWLQACETAGFDEAIPLSVAREAVLSGLDEPGASHRFRAGGVTFCTLMPMRAIPFEVVCLLGMNDGDYPRRSQRSDFDLMGLPGQSRPGDRSRRDDDRQLMLEALLSARQVFYVSWTGRSLRDNSEQPASVLVSQLRDYLAAGWRGEVLEQRTTEHPMQPFSRRYFEVSDPVGAQGSTLFTHAREWRVAHDALPQKALATQEPPDRRFVPDPAVPLTVALLVRFLKNPVKEFFRRRLDVTYRDEADTADDDEIFQLGALEQYQLLDTVTRELVECISADDRVAADTGVTPVGFDLRQQVRAQVARLRRAGALPLAEMGLRVEAEMVETVVPVLDAWTQLLPRVSTTVAKEPLSFVCDDIRVQDWLDGLRTDPGQPEERFRLDLTASKLSDAQGKSVRTGKLFDAWVRSLLASACGVPFTTVIVGRDATVTLPSPSRSQAAELLADLVRAWREGMSEPLPLACETALSAVRGEKDTAAVYEGGRYSRTGERGEVKDACLARMYPSFEALSADGRFTELALRVYGPIEHWAGTTSSVELHPAGDGDGDGNGSGNGEASAPATATATAAAMGRRAPMSEILQPLQLPLWGSRLIEASAGTGKTWTLASLYLRLILGHGGENAFPRPLAPSEILVMTFTRAATRELSDRIRSRLLEAAGCFRGQAEPELDDKLLADLLGEYPEGAERLAAAWRLASAAECMDDAAVHTIDAWCQRMLREHAFDSGCLFDEELTANEDAMLDEAVRDFWRQEVYPLSGDVLTQVLGVWPSMADLRKDAGELLKHELPTNAGQSSLVAALEGAVSDRAATLIALKVGWDQRASEMEAWLDALIATKPSPVKPRQLAKANYAKWLAALSAWARDPMLERPDMKTGAEKFTPKGMRGVLLEGSSVTVPAVFEAFGQLMRSLDQLATVNTGLRLHAASAISERLALLKARAGSFGFADMLTRLDDALDIDRNGDGAVRLRRSILAQYPVALVDEFQDTSPVQSRIFDRLYRIEDNEPATALLLIGDPKQSIYAFRGADIQSYLAARLATEGRHYVLGTNHRSTEGLVDAVNHLFDHAESRGGEGAFMFRADGAPAASSPLPFLRVTAKGRSETLRTSAGPCPALLMELDAALLDTSSSRRQFAARCAEHIATLLNDDQAGFDHPTKGVIRLRPADIAVLVRTGKEAAAVRRELRRRKVASVYLSDKDSVFESQEARDLIHWLRAVAAPRDTRLARAAMATPMAGLPIGELIKLATDDEVFDERCEQLGQLQIAWQSQGVLSMLRQTLHVLGIPARWLGASNTAAGAVDVEGERRLTNFMHLAELLQSASAEVEGEQALVRWLEGQIEGDASSGEEKIVRLESDADLVKVVTVHKSKGLEYPLVFLPFPGHFRGVDGKTKQVVLVDDAGRRRLHMQPTAEQVTAADKDRLREDLRLLYVALTRACHMLWVGLSALRIGNGSACVFPRSAIGYLLGGSGAADPDALPEQIAGIVKPCATIAIATAPPFVDLASTPVRSRGAPAALRQLSAYAGNFDRGWSIGSYSNMVRALALSALKASSDAVVRDDEVVQDVSDVQRASSPRSPVSAVPGAPPWHRFPRGALPGNFLHDQLEWLAGENFALAYEPDLQQRLLKRCERDGWGHRADDVLTWLKQVVSVTLPPMAGPLCELRSTLPEMEFWFPSENLVASAVDGLCRQQLLHGRDRPVLPARELHGMLMGFADLVFEQDGRYWVLDYKSNHLGNSDGDYTDEALESAMAAHRYDVQAALYLLALHRLLRTRLGAAYDPARHLGGAIYFFLRGVSSPGRGCYHVRPTPALLDGLDVLLGAQPAARKELA